MTKPNIILILTDHFRRDALGPHTPHIRRLATRGTRFANAYCASPLCQPSRANIITGMYNSQTGICGNQQPPISADLRDNSFMNRLRHAGYRTALVGKHHYLDRYGEWVDLTSDDDTIGAYGFDHVFQVADEIAAEATRFISEHAGPQPFYLNVSFVGPHPPYWHPGVAPDDDALPPVVGGADETREEQNLAGVAGYERISSELVEALLAHEVKLTRSTQAKEEDRLQRVHLGL